MRSLRDFSLEKICEGKTLTEVLELTKSYPEELFFDSREQVEKLLALTLGKIIGKFARQTLKKRLDLASKDLKQFCYDARDGIGFQMYPRSLGRELFEFDFCLFIGRRPFEHAYFLEGNQHFLLNDKNTEFTEQMAKPYIKSIWKTMSLFGGSQEAKLMLEKKDYKGSKIIRQIATECSIVIFDNGGFVEQQKVALTEKTAGFGDFEFVSLIYQIAMGLIEKYENCRASVCLLGPGHVSTGSVSLKIDFVKREIYNPTILSSENLIREGRIECRDRDFVNYCEGNVFLRFMNKSTGEIEKPGDCRGENFFPLIFSGILPRIEDICFVARGEKWTEYTTVKGPDFLTTDVVDDLFRKVWERLLVNNITPPDYGKEEIEEYFEEPWYISMIVRGRSFKIYHKEGFLAACFLYMAEYSAIGEIPAHTSITLTCYQKNTISESINLYFGRFKG